MVNEINQYTNVFKLRALYKEAPQGDTLETAKRAAGCRHSTCILTDLNHDFIYSRIRVHILFQGVLFPCVRCIHQ